MDKELLLKARLPEAAIDIDGVGTVRVRGLSRLEVLELRAADTSAPGSFERRMLASALIDPELTEDEVEQWQRTSAPHELEPVAKLVADLSAFDKAQAKAAYKEFESDPDGEFRVLPGAPAGDDGGSAPGGDER